ncbi:MAG: A/G-specific adenine glycosylase [Chitinophagales bacterium]|nr:A/G-specific adenine glycosylase [Chitinophagales bacterium]
MQSFNKKLINWHLKHPRNLPWKATNNAYYIWLSEIILQQTRVEQGLPYYEKFVQHYPKVEDLANAPLDEVLKLWEGLGYYSRARNLHLAAQQIVADYNGKLPNSYDELLKIKGIGSYTAAAIASFAFNLPHAVVDGNVFRVLARVFGIATPIDTTQGKKEFEALANQLLDKKQAALFNQAIMDFGAIQCVPRNPNCSICIFNDSCFAYINNKINDLPFKSKKIKKKERYFHFVVAYNQHNIVIVQRTEQDIWQSLFQFPMLETDTSTIPSDLQAFGINELNSFIYKQQLTHQKIIGIFYELKTEKIDTIAKKWNAMKVNKSKINNFAFPRIINNYLKDRFIYLI